MVSLSVFLVFPTLITSSIMNGEAYFLYHFDDDVVNVKELQHIKLHEKSQQLQTTCEKFLAQAENMPFFHLIWCNIYLCFIQLICFNSSLHQWLFGVI